MLKGMVVFLVCTMMQWWKSDASSQCKQSWSHCLGIGWASTMLWSREKGLSRDELHAPPAFSLEELSIAPVLGQWSPGPGVMLGGANIEQSSWPLRLLEYEELAVREEGTWGGVCTGVPLSLWQNTKSCRHRMGLLEGGQGAAALDACVSGSHDVERHWWFEKPSQEYNWDPSKTRAQGVLALELLFSCQLRSYSLWIHWLQHTRLPCPSLSLRVCSNSCPLSWWCYLTVSSSDAPFLLPSIFPSIRVSFNELVLCIRWPKYWSFSFSISPSNEYSRLISFRTDLLIFLQSKGTVRRPNQA